MLFERENTEEKIITATFNIVQKEGVQKATTKKIAAEAGVNEVTIFRKFENKKNLIEATKDYYMAKLLSNFLTKPTFIAYNAKNYQNWSRRICRKLYKNMAVTWTIKSQKQLDEMRNHFDLFIFDSFVPDADYMKK